MKFIIALFMLAGTLSAQGGFQGTVMDGALD